MYRDDAAKPRGARHAFIQRQIIDGGEVVDAGNRVVVIATMRGHGSASGVGIERRHGSVWTIRDGKAVRFQWFYEPEQALEAVGLRE